MTSREPASGSRLGGLASNIAAAAPARPADGAPAAGPLSNDELRKLKQWLIGRISSGVENPSELKNTDGTRREIETRLAEALAGTRVTLPETI
ncbi:MAG: hypothetical protein ABI847_17565, partial [Anaerolineales bacterium]